MKFIVASLLAAITLLMACSKDNPTQPAQQGSLYLSRLVVSMVPGGSETVKVRATDSNGMPGQCQATSSNPSVASVTVSDTTIQITGLSYGTTDITVTNGSGQSKILPVQVYDCQVLDTGDLLVTFVDQFEFIVAFSPPGWDPISFWKPIPPAGFYALGTYLRYGADNPNGVAAVMAVKEKAGSNAITFTSNFQNIGTVLHNPIAPTGFKAMGQVITLPGQTPAPAACIREDLTTPGAAYMFWSYENNFHQTESAWSINQPDAGAHESAYLTQGTAIYMAGTDGPGPGDPLVNILNVQLPMLAEAPVQEYSPSLEDYGPPPDGFAPRMEKAMLVPCTIVKDDQYNYNLPWRLANSPFYRMERQVYYKLINHYDNHQGSIPQSFDWEITYGINATQSQTVWNETGVELSVEAGVSIYAVETKVTATVSRNFGYERMNSVTELESRSLTIHANIPAGKSGALWQRYNRYVIYRHNGADLEPVTSWEFGINSYVFDEYPN